MDDTTSKNIKSHQFILTNGVPSVFVNNEKLQIITISYNFVGGTDTKPGLSKAVIAGCLEDSDEILLFEFDYNTNTITEL